MEIKPLDAQHYHKNGTGWQAVCKLCRNKGESIKRREARLAAGLRIYTSTLHFPPLPSIPPAPLPPLPQLS